jgi:hypothetical protein
MACFRRLWQYSILKHNKSLENYGYTDALELHPHHRDVMDNDFGRKLKKAGL